MQPRALYTYRFLIKDESSLSLALRQKFVQYREQHLLAEAAANKKYHSLPDQPSEEQPSERKKFWNKTHHFFQESISLYNDLLNFAADKGNRHLYAQAFPERTPGEYIGLLTEMTSIASQMMTSEDAATDPKIIERVKKVNDDLEELYKATESNRARHMQKLKRCSNIWLGLMFAFVGVFIAGIACAALSVAPIALPVSLIVVGLCGEIISLINARTGNTAYRANTLFDYGSMVRNFFKSSVCQALIGKTESQTEQTEEKVEPVPFASECLNHSMGLRFKA